MLLSMKMALVFISMIKTESKLKLCERHPWKSWNKVKIDHYLTTSQFIFQGERNWILSFSKRKRSSKIIEEHTSLQTEVVSRSFLKNFLVFVLIHH